MAPSSGAFPETNLGQFAYGSSNNMNAPKNSNKIIRCADNPHFSARIVSKIKILKRKAYGYSNVEYFKLGPHHLTVQGTIRRCDLYSILIFKK